MTDGGDVVDGDVAIAELRVGAPLASSARRSPAALTGWRAKRDLSETLEDVLAEAGT